MATLRGGRGEAVSGPLRSLLPVLCPAGTVRRSSAQPQRSSLCVAGRAVPTATQRRESIGLSNSQALHTSPLPCPANSGLATRRQRGGSPSEVLCALVESAPCLGALENTAAVTIMGPIRWRDCYDVWFIRRKQNECTGHLSQSRTSDGGGS